MVEVIAAVGGAMMTACFVSVGSVSYSDLENIAQLKMKDLNANTLEQAVEMIKGTCVSMGIEVKG